jgi:hypothetical protein
VKPGLFEMMIAGQAVTFHHDKGDAVGEGPVLIGTVDVQLGTTIKQLPALAVRWSCAGFGEG